MVSLGDVFVSAECSEVMDTNTGGVATKHSDILTDHNDDGDDTKLHCDSVSVGLSVDLFGQNNFCVDFL